MKSIRQYLPRLIFGILTILIIGGAFITYEYKVNKDEQIVEFGRSLRAASIAIEGADLNKLSQTEDDVDLPEYQHLRKKLQGLWDVYLSMGVRGFYIMKLSGGRIRFVVDSAETDDPWHSEPGVIYREPSSDDLKTFKDGQDKFFGPVKDEYGTFYSFLSPMKDQAGNVVAVLAADSEMKTFEQRLNQKMYHQIILLALILLGYILTIIWMSRSNSRLSSR